MATDGASRALSEPREGHVVILGSSEPSGSRRGPVGGRPIDGPVRIGVVGVGHRGVRMIETMLAIDGVEVTAVSDTSEAMVERAQAVVEAAGRPRPVGLVGETAHLRLAELDAVDAVFTAAPWHLHTRVMVASMEAGKYAATEMPACNGIDEAWELVEVSERTGVPCMLMENYTYLRDVQMVLNMVRQGVLGDLSHCEVGYQHDTRYVTISKDGELLWRAHERALHNNGNRYPTHAIGPASQWANINRGDRYDYLVSMSSRSQGLNHYAAEMLGPDHPLAHQPFALGDVNTSLIRTVEGITITLYYDPQTPRPRDFIWRVQGTKGIHSGTLRSVHIEGRSPKDEWEPVDAYRDEFEHPTWRLHAEAAHGHGHRGSDYMVLLDFVKAVRHRTEVPIDVYDAATWSVITELTERSVADRSRPVDFPDFTRGRWKDRPPLPIEAI